MRPLHHQALRGLRYWRQPRYLASRIAYKLYELRHPDEPWMAPGAIRFLAQRLEPDMLGFEWGSGRSTGWFGRRIKRLVSIEHDPAWHAQVSARVAGLPSVECRLILLDWAIDGPNGPFLDPMPRYVLAIDEFADASLDVIVVDGHYRQACSRHCLGKLRPGGLLVIDNTDWPWEWYVPDGWPILHRSRSVMGETTVWQKP